MVRPFIGRRFLTPLFDPNPPTNLLHPIGRIDPKRARPDPTRPDLDPDPDPTPTRPDPNPDPDPTRPDKRPDPTRPQLETETTPNEPDPTRPDLDPDPTRPDPDPTPTRPDPDRLRFELGGGLDRASGRCRVGRDGEGWGGMEAGMEEGGWVVGGVGWGWGWGGDAGMGMG